MAVVGLRIIHYPRVVLLYDVVGERGRDSSG